jgi:CyaY protein
VTVGELSEAEYDERAFAELRSLVDALDELADDGFEAELASDILTIEFSDDTCFVLNSHRAARQLWMAAERNAWHFDWLPERSAWIAHKSGDELWSTLERALSHKLGKSVTLARS